MEFKKVLITGILIVLLAVVLVLSTDKPTYAEYMAQRTNVVSETEEVTNEG